MKPSGRAKRICKTVVDAIVPRLQQGLGPVDFDALQRAITAEIEEAVRESRSVLFLEEYLS